jgi:hypothetical protein
MSTLRLAILLGLVTHAGVAVVAAQDLRGYVAGGVTSEVTHQQFPSVAGGVLVNVGQPWLYLSHIDGLPCESFGLQSYCEANPRAAHGYLEHQVAVRVGVLF